LLNESNHSPYKKSHSSALFATGFLLIPLVLVCLGLAPMVQAVGPDTDGTIPGSNNGEGTGVLVSRTGGIWNTGTGFEALNHLTAGNQNTATGLRALTSDTNGGFNTATGVLSLFSNTSGFFNSATGAYSLANNTIASYNTANGYAALYYNTEGEQNTATGFAALYRNSTGIGNTANGYQALLSNTGGGLVGGSLNTATGASALSSNTTGAGNTATGYGALADNTSDFNTATGFGALNRNTSGTVNTAIGWAALENSTGDSNIALGFGAGAQITTGNGNVAIGVVGANVSDTTWIRNIYTTVQPVVGTDPDNVTVNSDGRLGRGNMSSRRYKHDIKPMDNASEAILALKPVTFRYNKEYDTTQTLAYGLIAEDVAQVYPDLVGRNREGQPESVRYEQINAMLLNEFLKEHHKAQQQEATITQLKSTVTKEEAAIAQQRNDFEATIRELKKEMETVVVRLKEQDAKIQQVSDQIELSKPAPRTVLNDQ